MLNTCSQVQWRRRPTTVVAVLLALASLTTALPQTPMKSGLSAPSTLPPSSVNYFAANEAYQPLAVLDLLETTMQIYHGYRHHSGNGGTKNDTSNFTMGVVLVALTEDQFNGAANAFSPNRLRPAYSMQDVTRRLKVPDVVYEQAVRLLRDADELTIGAVMRQERANTGSIVSFSLDSNRYLELESSGRKDEVRLHYVSQGSRRVHTEVFAYALADGRWHAVAVTLSGAQARLFVDCRLVYTRTLVAGPADTSFADSPDLYVGQRNAGVHSVFKGLLQDVRLVRGADGQRAQCPSLDTSCPTCGQFAAVQRTMERLDKIVRLLSDKLEAAETRIAELETCECRKACVQTDERNNTVMKTDGSVWQYECETCTCLRGQVECSPVRCPSVDCKFPVRKPGECCDTCQKTCRTKGDIVFEHGDTINLEPCLSCICLNGVVKCDKVDAKTQCPTLECDESEQFSVPDQCCKFCPGVDYCARGGRDSCHPNATCINLKTTHKCACAVGYAGTGLQCDDVDECSNAGGPNGHHCDANTTVCVNTPGSYVCHCNAGYARLNRFECADIDECDQEESPCHLHAKCTNTLGGFSCACADGYEGDGYTCRPVCRQQCLNGGMCTRPNVCTCPNAFEGPACELDVDECATGAHGCLGPSSRCVNMAGWYYCACSPGYQNVIMYPIATAFSEPVNALEAIRRSPQLGTMCQDIDECAINNHTCHSSAMCVNTIGSYECKCPSDNVNAAGNVSSLECKTSCLHKVDGKVITEVIDGGWIAPNECTNCTCTGGRLHCAPVECDCTKKNNGLGPSSNCCAHCDAQASCAHQELPNVRFRSGQQWIYQCQTCECLMGQVDCWPMQCPPMVPVGSGGCTNSTFADYNNPVAGCCAPRCNSKAAVAAAALASPTTIAITNPCLQPQNQLDVYHGSRDAGNNDNDNSKYDNNNTTTSPTAGKPCFYEGRTYHSGARWDDPVDMCTSCDCKNGILCCSYNVRHCNNGTVAGTTTGRPPVGGGDVGLSAATAGGVPNENGASGQPAAVGRRRRRRRAAAAGVATVRVVRSDGGGGGGGGGVTRVVRGDGQNTDADNSDGGFDGKHWRRKRRRTSWPGRRGGGVFGGKNRRRSSGGGDDDNGENE